jgi:Uncharacterized protein conserved in bacteria (DUF2252)
MMKIKLLVELFTLKVMVQYAEHCGWALARAHVRAGQPSLIAQMGILPQERVGEAKDLFYNSWG